MKNSRRIYHQLRYAIWITRGLGLILFGLVTLFPILKPPDTTLSFQVLFGLLSAVLILWSIKSIMHDRWHKAVQEQALRTEDFCFLVEAHTDKLIPNIALIPENAPPPMDQDRRMITTHLFQHLWKINAESVNAMPQTERTALISLLKSDDVRIVRRVLEIVEQSLLIEAIPSVHRLVYGKLKSSGDLSIDKIADRVLTCLEIHGRSEQQQYLRPSAAPNDQLLHPAVYVPANSQKETLLHPLEKPHV